MFFELTEQRIADQARAIKANGVELEEMQRNTENGHCDVDAGVSSSSTDSNMRTILETVEEPVDHEAVGVSDSSIGSKLSVQDLCNALKMEGLSEDDINLVKSVLEEKNRKPTPRESKDCGTKDIETTNYRNK